MLGYGSHLQRERSQWPPLASLVWQPFFIWGCATAITDRELLNLAPDPIAFAGLISRRTLEGDKTEFTCTILTRDAVGSGADIHTRMPVALPKDAEAAWLDRELSDAAMMIAFARENAIQDFAIRAVNPKLNNARNEGADLIELFENPA